MWGKFVGDSFINNMRSSTLRWIVLLATLLIVVIMGVQLYWLNLVYSLEGKTFRTNVAKSVRGLYEDIEITDTPTIHLQDAIEQRGEAFMGVDHLDEAKAAYMDLFFHARPLADQMMTTMQGWLQSHRASANGVRATDIDAFDKWLQEREGIAKTTAAN